MLEETGCDQLEEGDASRPLQIVVTERAGEELRLRSLAREPMSMLRQPEAYTEVRRERLAESFLELLSDACAEEDEEGGEWP